MWNKGDKNNGKRRFLLPMDKEKKVQEHSNGAASYRTTLTTIIYSDIVGA